jgi:hypothetical protein
MTDAIGNLQNGKTGYGSRQTRLSSDALPIDAKEPPQRRSIHQ